MHTLLKECRQLHDGLCFLYSPRARKGNSYDTSDLVLGHGMDNLWSLRLLMALALIA